MIKQRTEYAANHREEKTKYNKQYYEENKGRYKESNRKCYLKKKQYINDYKSSKGCSVCGYNKSVYALVFHHPNDDKEFGIGSRTNFGLERLKREMAKCIILCRNCHAELHEKIFKGVNNELY